MKKKQYIIKNLDNDLHVQWDKATILFDSQWEAERFIEMFSNFFENANFELLSGIYFLSNSINYKDIQEEKILEELESRKGE